MTERPLDPARRASRPTELLTRIADDGATVPAPTSGYLQFVGYPTLVDIATGSDAVIELLHRPGHFVVEGLPLAQVWPAEAAPAVARGLERAHATGAHRTLAQDLAFAIDQLVEIAIRALSPAVNDTFTALTCIDWLGDGLCKISARSGTRRESTATHAGASASISAEAPYGRLVDRAFDKIRQAGRGMPAVMIRQLDSIAKILAYTTSDEQRTVLRNQAEMIWRSTCEAVPEPCDRADVRAQLRRGGGVVGPGDRRRVGPQALEPVVLARLVEEHVHDEIAVVEQHPRRVREALRPRGASRRSARRSAARSRRRSTRTSRVFGRARDHEALDDADDVGDVEDEDVLALLVVGRAGCDPGLGPTSPVPDFTRVSAGSASRGSGHTLPCCGVMATSVSRMRLCGVQLSTVRSPGPAIAPSCGASRGGPRPARPATASSTTPACSRRSRRRRRSLRFRDPSDHGDP